MMDWARLLLRVGLGTVFIGHGLQKAFGVFGGPGIGGFTQFLATIGFRPAGLWAYIAAYVELIGGILVLLGIFTRASSLLLLAVITVAAVTVHLGKGFFLAQGGFEYALVIACICVALILLGAGKFSIFNKF